MTKKNILEVLGVIVLSAGCSSTSPSALSGTSVNTLTVTVTGAGSGTVTSDIGSISCTKTSASGCTYAAGTTAVTLTATPDTGYIFNGWVGGSCTRRSACQVTMTESTTVKAAFVPFLYQSSRPIDGTVGGAKTLSANLWLQKTDGSGATALTALTAAGTDVNAYAWSADGTKVVYASTRATNGTDAGGPQLNVWIINSDGTGNTALTTLATANASEPSFSPDGTKIAYGSTTPLDGTDAVSCSNIWTMNIDGTSKTAMTNCSTFANGINFTPTWSVDGTKILHMGTMAIDGSDASNTGSTSNIWTVTYPGAVRTALTTYTNLTSGAYVGTWSQDGTKVLFQSTAALDGSNTNGPQSNIWTMNSDGTGLTHLTALTAVGAFSPSWSLDDSLVSYRSTRALDGTDAVTSNTILNVWDVPAAGGTSVSLTNLNVAGLNSGGGRWISGSSLLFFSNKKLDGTAAVQAPVVSNIWKMASDGSQQTPLTEVTTLNASSFYPNTNYH